MRAAILLWNLVLLDGYAWTATMRRTLAYSSSSKFAYCINLRILGDIWQVFCLIFIILIIQSDL